MSNVQISPHFSLYELTKTDHEELQENNRIVHTEFVRFLYALAYGILEPIRRHYNRPVIIHSCWRSPQLNRAIHGASSKSQHCSAQAADFHVEGIPALDLWNWIRMNSGLPFGQVILELPSTVHVSLGKPIWRRSGEALKRIKSVDEDTRDVSYSYERIE